MLREKIRNSHSPAQYNELPTNEMKALFLTDNRGLAGLAINNGPGKFDLPTLSLREDCRHCAFT